jgi:hypothetical protein
MMNIVGKLSVDEVCCKDMQEMIDKNIVTFSTYNFYFYGHTIFWCPFCGRRIT